MNRFTRWLDRLAPGQVVGIMAGLFALIHAAYWLAGVRFDLNPLSHFWQVLDPELLRTRLLESALYLHIQPPFFNLLVGAMLKLFAGSEQLAFTVLYAALGFGLYLLIFRLMRFLGVGRTLALVFSTWFAAGPAFVLYEHWLAYTFPLAFLLAAAAWFLAHWLRSGRWWAAWGFFMALALLCGTRSLFQFVHFLVLFAALLAVSRGRWRTVVLAAVLPGLLIAALYGKNLLLFGRFTTSTWLGMNLWGVAARDLPPADLAAMVARGELSPVSAIDRFTPLAEYPPEYRDADGFPDAPALRQAVKSTGAVNYNHAAYLRISDAYLADALRLVVQHPGAFLTAVAKGWFNYFRSGADYVFLSANRSRVGLLNDAWDLLFYGKIPFDLSQVEGLPLHEGGSRYFYLFLLLGLPAVWVYGLAAALRPGGRFSRDQRWLLLFLCFNILYVAFLGNLLEVGENNRFRFMTDPYSVILAALLVHHAVIPWLRNRPARGRSMP